MSIASHYSIAQNKEKLGVLPPVTTENEALNISTSFRILFNIH